MRYLVTKMVSVSSLIEVEANSEDEAIEKVDDAWAESETFVKNVMMSSEIDESETYVNTVQDPSYYDAEVHSLDEMCRYDLLSQ